MIRNIVFLLENLLKLNRATENLLIDIVASYSPWVAPMVPAYMTYQHMTTQLDFPTWVAFAAAICVETLGLSSIQTAVSFWQWNDAKHKSDPRAPVILALAAGVFYLATVLTVNAMLDNTAPIYRLAKALLSSLSVCAGLILALRAGHTRRIAETEQLRQVRKAERAAARASKPVITSPLAVMIPTNGNGTRQVESTR